MQLLAPIGDIRTGPVDSATIAERLRLSLLSAGYALAAVPALVLAIATIVAIPLGLIAVGFAVALVVVPATAVLANVHRRVSGALLDVEIGASYADTAGTHTLGRPIRWLDDGARWRDVGFLWYSATGGFVMSAIPPLLLCAPLVHVTGLVLDPGRSWVFLLAVSGTGLFVWWRVTPPLVRARAMIERAVLGSAELARLERRVTEVTESRRDTVDVSAAEIRRIERDLHDGAQARIAALGMTVGLAEKLVPSDPDAAVDLLGEARQTVLAALDDLRSVVRGVHPPVLAERGLAGAIEALAVPIPLPVTVAVGGVDERLPDPVESAAYFAVAECLANVVKHADATRAYVTGSHDGALLRLVVGDDGRGGADPAGTGLTGIARRLAAFDGTVTVDSPPGGPTVIALEIPCPT